MSKPTILFVDDEVAALEPMRELLEARGVTVLFAENGKEGLAVATKVRPALILLDLIMPVMTGYEFLRHLWAMEELQDIPVVVVTGAHVPNPGGTVGFLRKPINLTALLEVVDRHVLAQGRGARAVGA